MRQTLPLLLTLLYSAPLMAQRLTLQLQAAELTDRHAGLSIESSTATGVGGVAGARLEWHRFAVEISALGAQMSRNTTLGSVPDSGESNVQHWKQSELRAHGRFLLLPQIGLEAWITRRFLVPDFDGEEIGAVGAGIYAMLPISRSARLRGRLGYLPYATFSGAGKPGFAAETQLGIELDLWRGLRLAGEYQFQRIDRNITDILGGSVASRIEFDIIRVGLAVPIFSRGR